MLLIDSIRMMNRTKFELFSYQFYISTKVLSQNHMLWVTWVHNDSHIHFNACSASLIFLSFFVLCLVFKLDYYIEITQYYSLLHSGLTAWFYIACEPSQIHTIMQSTWHRNSDKMTKSACSRTNMSSHISPLLFWVSILAVSLLISSMFHYYAFYQE